MELTIDRLRMGSTTNSWIVILKDPTNPESPDYQMPLPETWKHEDVKKGIRVRCRLDRMRGHSPIVNLDTSIVDSAEHPEWGYFDDLITKLSEGSELEKKTSIVFDPSTRRADIQQQLGFTIMKVIASLANKRGGYIYFGIHDTDNITPVRGIHGDFQEIKKFGEHIGRHYSASVDGYMLVIQDFAKQRLGAGILGLLDFDPLMTAQGLIVLRLYVKPCRRSTPVWYENERIFVREGSRCDEKKGAVKMEFLNAWGDHLAKLPPPETDSKDALYFSIHDDGSISMRERKRAGHEITHRIYVRKGVTIPGHLLLVFSNGTLVFLDPNQLQKEIKENEGFARFRIPDDVRVVAAFYHVVPVYLLAVVLWQGELDGFKLFNPQELFDGDIVTENPLRFLPEEEMELRECLKINDGIELDSFVALHPLLRQSGHGLTPFRKDLFSPYPSDFGRLVQDVDPKLYTDLLQFARTGYYPKISPHVRKESAGFLTVSCATWETYKFVVKEHLPESPLLIAEDVPPSRISLPGRGEHVLSPSEAWQHCHQAVTGQNLYSALENNQSLPRTGDVLFVFDSGAVRRMSWATSLSCLDDTTQALYLRTRELLRGVYYCHSGDYLVMLLNIPDLEDPVYLFVPTSEIPSQSRLLLQQFSYGESPMQETVTILGIGILHSETVERTAKNLRGFWNSWPIEDPRCPIDGFSPQLWNRFRSARDQAVVSQFRNGELNLNKIPGIFRHHLKGAPPMDQVYPSLKWIEDCPELAEATLTYSYLFIPEILMKSLNPELVKKLNDSARKENVEITFSANKPLLPNPYLTQFLHSALVVDENSQTVEVRLSAAATNFRLHLKPGNSGFSISWEEESPYKDPG